MYYPIFEFVLWNNCSNNCQFCWQKKHTLLNNIKEQINSLDNVQKIILESDSFLKFHVLLIGGEIFDIKDIDVQHKFFETVKIICDLQLQGKIQYFYINTNFLYNDLTFIIDFIKYVQKCGLVNSLKFATSYDKYGRYSNYKSEQLFFDNLRYIKNHFPELNIVVNTILTKQCCDYILKNKFSFVNFFKTQFGCYNNLIPFVNTDNRFLPKQIDVLSVFMFENSKSKDYFKKYLSELLLPQQKIVYRFLNGKFSNCSDDLMKCGHGKNFYTYSSNDTCFICDLIELGKIL